MNTLGLIHWLRKVRDARLTHAQRSVALALALRARNGETWPAMATLAADAQCRPTAARGAIRHLEALGLVRVGWSPGRLANTYRLIMPADEPEAEQEPAPNPPASRKVRKPTLRLDDANPSARRRQPSGQPNPEWSKNERKNESLLSGLRPTGKSQVSLSEVEALIGHLNAKTGARFEVRAATGKLTSGAEAARQRITEHGLERMMAVVDAKAAEWLGTEQAKYLRPATLFRRSKAENYAGQLGLPPPPKGNGARPPGGGQAEPSGAAYRPFSFD
jgi:uncharacterized phage protein (TIGR02220 family)